VIIEVGEVPDAALDALIEAMPVPGQDNEREDWRQALAAALTQWEKRPRDLVPLMGGHDCAWQTLAVQPHVAMLGVKVTDALQRRDGCGDVRTQVLTGTWTLEQLRG
jgi:hypothetical protein